MRRPHERILRALGRFHVLTSWQVTHLLFTPGMRRDAQRWLAELTFQGYVFSQPGFSRGAGRPPAIFSLDRRGREYAAALGLWAPERARRSELGQRRHLFHEHTLALNDVLISLELLARQDPRLWLAELVHEQRLKREKIAVVWPDGTCRFAEPDAWVDLRLVDAMHPPWRVPLLIELDRGTEEQRQFRAKIRTLLALLDGPYRTTFQTEYATVAIVVADPERPERRRDQLLAWIAAELCALEREDAGALFFVSASDPVTTPPDAMWCAPHWRRPFAPRPQPLLTGREGGR